MLELPVRQDLQESNQRPLCLPKCAEDWFFEAPTCASKVYGTFGADEDDLVGDVPRQFADLENAMGRARAVVDHGRLYGT